MNKGYLLVTLTAIISGFSIFINKFGVGIFKSSEIYTFLRVSLVALILGSILLIFDSKKIKSIKKIEWILLALIGLVGGSIPFLLFFKGLKITSSAEGSFIHKTMFLWVAILATLFLKEKIDRKFLFGALILLFANALLLKKFSFFPDRGDLLILIATIFWAIENTLSKYLLSASNLDGKTVAFGRMFFGSIFILIYLIFTNQASQIFVLNSKQVIWVLITGTILLFYVLTWYSGLKYIPVSKATAILLLGSPVTTALNLISGAKIPSQEMISGILVLIGIVTIFGIKKTLENLKSLIYARA
jgi:drug/metabolite transporter (DMT)-like permease